MKTEDWSKIVYFKESSVRATGADPETVQLRTMLAIDKFRTKVGCPVFLAQNGLTTGNHKSKGHPAGLAVDCYIRQRLPVGDIFKAALYAGFTAIGIYWNGQAFSFHLEIDDTGYRFWTGKKPLGFKGGWTFGELIRDPSL